MDNNLIEPDGIFLLDNTLWKGELFQNQEALTPTAIVFKELNEFIRKDPRVTQVINKLHKWFV